MSVFRLAAVVLMAVAVVACSGKPDHMGVEVNGEYLGVIDSHLHTGNWEGSTQGFRDRPHSISTLMLRRMSEGIRCAHGAKP